MEQKHKSPKVKKSTNSSDKSDQGAFTKKSWKDSTTGEKVKGVAATGLAAAALGATLYHAMKK